MAETELFQVNLGNMLDSLEEGKVKNYLSSFMCPNKDVENFLKEKAVLFSKQGYAKTHLVFWECRSEDGKRELELVGYYALAPKEVVIKKDALSKSKMKKIRGFHVGEDDETRYRIPAILIGQLGKNFQGGNDCLIKGSELLDIALEKIRAIQFELGGKIVYLECEEDERLVNFYESNGFQPFGRRELDHDEVDCNGKFLLQFLKYIN